MVIDDKILYKLLRYILQTAVIYLILRYTPYVNLDTNKALIATIVLFTLSLALEFLFVKFHNMFTQEIKQETNTKPEDKLLEKFQSEGCNDCKVEKFTSETTNKKCRIVCDDDEKDKNKKIEGFAETSKQEVPTNNDVNANSNVNDDSFSYGFGGMFYDEYPYYNRYNHSTKEDGNQQESKMKEAAEERRVLNDRKAIEDAAYTTAGYPGPYQDGGSKSERRKGFDPKRRIEGDIDDEMQYSNYNQLPVAAGYKSHDYEYGYNFIPPERWAPNAVTPPICVTSSRCPILPMYANGTPADVKEFYSASRFMPPDLISTDYIKDKLNT